MYHVWDRGQILLFSHCDGEVCVSREEAKLDFSLFPVQREYQHREDESSIYKLTFNVIPRPMSRVYRLRHVVQ